MLHATRQRTCNLPKAAGPVAAIPNGGFEKRCESLASTSSIFFLIIVIDKPTDRNGAANRSSYIHM
ncbi:hypothetical protein V8C26DRAFT_400947 [Trichoderma gracile]